jgi:hypothetical protein
VSFFVDVGIKVTAMMGDGKIKARQNAQPVTEWKTNNEMTSFKSAQEEEKLNIDFYLYDALSHTFISFTE